MDTLYKSQTLSGMSKHIIRAEIQERCTKTIVGGDCYRLFQDIHFHYGPAFQSIEQLWIAPGEALGHIRVPESVEDGLLDYHMHPVVLDACFQVLLAVAVTDSSQEHERKGVYLPVGIERIQVHARPKLSMWSHARLVKQSAELLEGDITLFDEEGTVLVEVQGFRVQSLEQISVTPPQQLDKWLYETLWVPMVGKEDGESLMTDEVGNWLIFADNGGYGAKVASLLEERGQTCVLIFPGETYARLAPGHYTLNIGRPEDYRRLIEEMFVPDLPRCAGIVHLWSLDARPSEELTSAVLRDEQERITCSVLHLVQALGQRDNLPRLWLTTSGGQPVGLEEAPLSLAQSPLWGMGRVLYEEHLSLRGALVDLDPSESLDDAVAQLWQEISYADEGNQEENQVAYRSGQRFVARLEHVDVPQAPMPVHFRPDASYLITGGLGALGLLVSRWMIQHGARRLILVGRTPLPPRSQWNALSSDSPQAELVASIRELEKLGAAIHLAQFDISDEVALAAFLEEYACSGWPPIRGVIHSAGIVQDQFLMQMTKEAFVSVLQPKVQGAWSLHRCLQDVSLDFFVLFSSIASVVVSPTQGNYAAGNAFLDALAYFRRSQGLPAMSINWGPWATGMITRLNLTGLYNRRGVDLITPEYGMHILDQLFGFDRIQTVVASVDWPTFFESYTIIPPLIHHLGKTEDVSEDITDEGRESILQQLLRVSQEEGPLLMQAYLLKKVAQVLRCEQSVLDVSVPLNAYGMDSMIAIELKNRIENDTHISLSIVALLQGTTITQLALQILTRLQAEGEPGEETQEDLGEQIDEATLLQLLEEIEQMSQDDVAAQLAAEKQ